MGDWANEHSALEIHSIAHSLNKEEETGLVPLPA